MPVNPGAKIEAAHLADLATTANQKVPGYELGAELWDGDVVPFPVPEAMTRFVRRTVVDTSSTQREYAFASAFKSELYRMRMNALRMGELDTTYNQTVGAVKTVHEQAFPAGRYSDYTGSTPWSGTTHYLQVADRTRKLATSVKWNTKNSAATGYVVAYYNGSATVTIDETSVSDSVTEYVITVNTFAPLAAGSIVLAWADGATVKTNPGSNPVYGYRNVTVALSGPDIGHFTAAVTPSPTLVGPDLPDPVVSYTLTLDDALAAGTFTYTVRATLSGEVFFQGAAETKIMVMMHGYRPWTTHPDWYGYDPARLPIPDLPAPGSGHLNYQGEPLWEVPVWVTPNGHFEYQATPFSALSPLKWWQDTDGMVWYPVWMPDPIDASHWDAGGIIFKERSLSHSISGESQSAYYVAGPELAVAAQHLSRDATYEISFDALISDAEYLRGSSEVHSIWAVAVEPSTVMGGIFSAKTRLQSGADFDPKHPQNFWPYSILKRSAALPAPYPPANPVDQGWRDLDGSVVIRKWIAFYDGLFGYGDQEANPDGTLKPTAPFSPRMATYYRAPTFFLRSFGELTDMLPTVEADNPRYVPGTEPGYGPTKFAYPPDSTQWAKQYDFASLQYGTIYSVTARRQTTNLYGFDLTADTDATEAMVVEFGTAVSGEFVKLGQVTIPAEETSATEYLLTPVILFDNMPLFYKAVSGALVTATFNAPKADTTPNANITWPLQAAHFNDTEELMALFSDLPSNAPVYYPP